MTAAFHTWLYDRFIEIQSNLRTKKFHRTNQGSNFLGGSFSNRDNVRAPIQFRKESQPQQQIQPQQNKSSISKENFRKASNCCKRVLEAAKLVYANKTKKFITSQKLGSRDFWSIANSVLNKGVKRTPPGC